MSLKSLFKFNPEQKSGIFSLSLLLVITQLIYFFYPVKHEYLSLDQEQELKNRYDSLVEKQLQEKNNIC